MRLVISIIFSFILISCGQTTSGVDPVQTQKRIDKQIEKQQEIKEDVVSDIPDWWLEPPMDTEDIFYFVGQGESKQLQMSLDIAILEAKEELASAINSYLSSQTKKFVTQSGIGDDMVLTTSLEEATKAVVLEAQTGGYRVAKKEVVAKDNKYMTYVLLEYIAGHANKLLYNQIKKDAETEAKIRQTEAFKELEEAIANS